VFVSALSFLSSTCLFSHMEQVWLLRATAHGVRLASIRLGWVWLTRSTAHGALLGSTRLDQVQVPENVEVMFCSESVYALNPRHLFNLWNYGLLAFCHQNRTFDHGANG
jgi:hypothetical protein